MRRSFSTHRGIWIKAVAFKLGVEVVFFLPNVFDIVYFACLCRIFGHFSHRSEWQLVKIDFQSIFQHRCTSEDYMTWQLHNEVRGSCCYWLIKPKWISLIHSHNKSKMVQYKTKKRQKEPLKCLWCIIYHRAKCASWEWRESSKNWKQTFDVSRPEISIFPRYQTPARAQRQILSGEFPTL